MTSFSLCLLSIVIAIDAKPHEDIPILNSPTNIRILEDGASTALLVWDFETPLNVSLPEIEFIVELESRGKPLVDFHPHFRNAPFNITLEGLEQLSQYSVRLRAAKPEWRDSPTAKISFYFPLGGLPVLRPPTNLRAGHRNETSALVVWDHVQPDGVPLAEITFILLLQSGKRPIRRIPAHFVFPKFHYSFDGLTPMTTYTVKIQASTARWKESAIAEISFTTPRTDWPKPAITEVRSKPHDARILVTVTWKIDEILQWLQYYRIFLCAPDCFDMRKDKRTSAVTLSIKYDTKFTISIVAVYNIPVIGVTTRSSATYSARTGTNIFTGAAAEIPRPKFVGLSVYLPWLPSYVPHGPTPYYEFFICDKTPPLGPSINLSLIPTSIRGDVDLPKHPFGGSYGGHLLPTEVVDDFNQCPIPRPLEFVMVKRLPNAVRFRIIFKDAANCRFDRGLDSLRLKMGPSAAEHFNLAPFTPFNIVVRSCLANEGENLCGNFSQFNTLSNVAAPSTVENLRLHPRDRGGGLSVSWEPPKEPHGPIDGYKVIVKGKPVLQKGKSEFTLKSSQRSLILENFDPKRAYRIEVSAFNIDIESSLRRLEGEWNFIDVDPPKPFPAMVFIVLVGVVVVVVVVSAVCVILFCLWGRRRVQPTSGPAVRYSRNHSVDEPRPPGYDESMRLTRPPGDYSEEARIEGLRAHSGREDPPPAYEDIVRQPPWSISSGGTPPISGISTSPPPPSAPSEFGHSEFRGHESRSVEGQTSRSSTPAFTDCSEGTWGSEDLASPSSESAGYETAVSEQADHVRCPPYTLRSHFTAVSGGGFETLAVGAEGHGSQQGNEDMSPAESMNLDEDQQSNRPETRGKHQRQRY